VPKAKRKAITSEKTSKAKPNKFWARIDKRLEKHIAEVEKRKAAHMRERKSRGLSETAGTGNPEPEILIRARPKPPFRNVHDSVKVRERETLAKLEIGASRLGGLPDLPLGIQWPTFRRKKLPFVAQFNLAKFPKSVHRILPKDGHLFAFALISNDKRHWPPPVSVFLYRGPTSKLKRAKVPSEDEIWADWGGASVYEVLPATGKTVEQLGKTNASPDAWSLGWLFGEMWRDFGTAGKLADEQFGDGDDWINLIALHSGFDALVRCRASLPSDSSLGLGETRFLECDWPGLLVVALPHDWFTGQRALSPAAAPVE